MLESKKGKVCTVNIRLKTSGLITLTWGNVSEIDREHSMETVFSVMSLSISSARIRPRRS